MRKIILVAVDVRSAHNVGAFLRTADGFGASVMLVGITPRPTGSKDDSRLPHIAQKAHKLIAKTALGAEELVEWTYHSTFSDAVKELRNNNFKLCAVEQSESSLPISDLPGDKNIALIVGPEVTGLPQSVLKACDAIYEIPMIGDKESFNVSVAAGIALYQASLR